MGAQFASSFDGLTHIGAKGVVEGHADGGVIGVITETTFGDDGVGCFFEEHGVGADLEAIRGPSSGRFVGVAMSTAAFVFVGNPVSITPSQGIDFAEQSERIAFQDEPLGGPVGFFFFYFFVQSASCIHAGIGDADFFDFFEIKEPFAIRQGV